MLELLTAPAGLNAQLAELAGSEAELPARIEAAQMTPQNVAMELAERSRQVRYPAVHVYCERLVNNLREKFRTFAGTAQMSVEVRVSQDRLEGLEDGLGTLVEAVTRVLDRNRGDWGEGMFYGGRVRGEFRGGEARGQEFRAGGEGDVRGGREPLRAASRKDIGRWLLTFHRRRTGSTAGWRTVSDRFPGSPPQTGFRR